MDASARTMGSVTADNHVVDPSLKLVNEKKAASMLGWSTSTLQKDRCQRRRIAYVKLGSRVMYRVVDLRDYVEANVRR